MYLQSKVSNEMKQLCIVVTLLAIFTDQELISNLQRRVAEERKIKEEEWRRMKEEKEKKKKDHKRATE